MRYIRYRYSWSIYRWLWEWVGWDGCDCDYW